jgi:ABC-type transport system involved in cytochrome c biogenesis permease subunit
VSAYNQIAKAYRKGNAAEFNAAVSDFRASLAGVFQPELKKARQEQFFNRVEPFYKAMILFIGAFLCVLGYWMKPAGYDWLRLSAVGIVLLSLAILTCGLLGRMFLEGRPPVTNLYSSAIFIGWGATVLGLVLEKFWRNSIGVAVSSVIGFLTLIIAHHLSLSGDTMEMMRAVLDTNFWLATHVVVVTLGYASTFVAGFLAMIYILRGVFTRSLGRDLAKSLTRMIYGIICFATLFSFVGTVLGGIWADQSWGRFWGWDPKENGALIIVIWNALILHARWGGMVRERGLATLAIVGNIVTSWSWFGVNMLGIGLHSYGFTSAAFQWLLTFVISQLVIIGLGLVPQRYWRSFREAPPAEVPTKPQQVPGQPGKAQPASTGA